MDCKSHGASRQLTGAGQEAGELAGFGSGWVGSLFWRRWKGDLERGEGPQGLSDLGCRGWVVPI